MLDFQAGALWDAASCSCRASWNERTSRLAGLTAATPDPPSARSDDFLARSRFGLVLEDVEGGLVAPLGRRELRHARHVVKTPQWRPQAPETPPEEKKKRKTSTPAMVVRRSTAAQPEPVNPQSPSRRADGKTREAQADRGGLLTNISGENKLIKTAKGQLSPTQKALDAFANAAADIRSLASPRQSPRPPARRVSGLETAHRQIPSRSREEDGDFCSSCSPLPSSRAAERGRSPLTAPRRSRLLTGSTANRPLSTGPG